MVLAIDAVVVLLASRVNRRRRQYSDQRGGAGHHLWRQPQDPFVARGGGAVARSLGGRASSGHGDLALKRLHNVVEEMAIASGVTMPEVYVLENEDGINAFAAGNSPALSP